MYQPNEETTPPLLTVRVVLKYFKEDDNQNRNRMEKEAKMVWVVFQPF